MWFCLLFWSTTTSSSLSSLCFQSVSNDVAADDDAASMSSPTRGLRDGKIARRR